MVFDWAVFRTVDLLADGPWCIVSQADVVGFGASKISAQLGNRARGVVTQLKKARLAPWDAVAESTNSESKTSHVESALDARCV